MHQSPLPIYLRELRVPIRGDTTVMGSLGGRFQKTLLIQPAPLGSVASVPPWQGQLGGAASPSRRVYPPHLGVVLRSRFLVFDGMVEAKTQN
jgi:hypothetical protein